MIERLIVLAIYFVVCSFALINVVRRKGTIFEFPFLISLSTVGFILPQAFTCCTKPELVADDAYFMTMIYGIICHIMGYIGYYNFRTPPLTVRPAPLNPERIFHVGLVQIIAGVSGYVLMDIYVYKQPFGLFMTEGMYQTEWTGLPVAFEFACKFVFPGSMMVFFAIMSMARPRWYHWFFFCLGMLYPVLTIVLLGRRASVMLVAGVFVLPAFYVRRWIPNGYLVLFGSIAMALLVFLMPAYRKHFAYDADKSEIFRISPIKVLQDYFEGKETLEIPFQMHTVGGVYHTGRYGWGVDFYNTIIKGFVPSMFVGRERKNNMFLPGSEPDYSAATTYGQAHAGRNYLSTQGIVDSFWEFSFGGCVLFLLAGIATKWLYDRSMRDRSMRYALLSVMLGWLSPFIVYAGFLFVWRMLLLVIPVYLLVCWYASVPRQEVLPTLRSRRQSTRTRVPQTVETNRPAAAMPRSASRYPSLASNGSAYRNGNGRHQDSRPNGLRRRPR